MREENRKDQQELSEIVERQIGFLVAKRSVNGKNIEEGQKMAQKSAERLARPYSAVDRTGLYNLVSAAAQIRNIFPSEKVQQHIQETLIHKQLFEQSCMKMIDYLYKVGRGSDALELARRCVVHDNSKLSDEEIECFIQLPARKPGCQNSLTDEQKRSLETHWKNNRHHPEHFKDYHEMSEIDIMEMCCDWHARHIQYRNEMTLIEYVNDVQRKRFGFDDNIFEKIIEYCEILDKEE